MSAARCCIYVLTNKVTGLKYVGQSMNVDLRLQSHAAGSSGCTRLSQSIKKHGWQQFEVAILQECASDELNAAEVEWIDRLGTLHPGGYNLTTGGNQYRFSDDVRALISQRTKLGQTPEVCARMSAAKLGVPKSEAWKAKKSELQRTCPKNLARLAELARNQSAETREKIAASHRGKKASDETRAKISASKKGQNLGVRHWYPSDETRAKMSASAKARCAREKAEKEARA